MTGVAGNMRRLGVAAFLVAADVSLVLAETAHEAGHDAGHGAGHDNAAWMTLAFTFINFSIFLFLLNRYAWPAVRDFLANRQREVADAMAAAEQARLEAEAIRRDYAAKEAALDETRRRMLEEISRGAEADRAKLLKDAEAAAERMRADAERQAEHDLARARRELRAEAARLAADLAEKEVRSKLTDADRARLVREFVEGAARS
jgi:F-type H+-transporting ATPase subunit b